jgi:pimeloyl-ACP methyl ester carboxylesterase
MAQPAIVLVHGLWGDGAHWGKVILELAKRGHETILAVENPLTSLADDAERTRKMVAQQKGPVVLAGHSYGGFVISQAGNEANVVGLVYVAAFAPEAGESILSIGQGFPPPPGLANASVDSDGYVWLDRKKFRESFCQDLDADDAFVMAAAQKAPLQNVLGDKSGAPAWKSKPSWYQVSSEDRMIDPGNQKRMAERAGAKKTITLATGHASLASKPIEVAALIDEAAKAAAT